MNIFKALATDLFVLNNNNKLKRPKEIQNNTMTKQWYSNVREVLKSNKICPQKDVPFMS